VLTFLTTFRMVSGAYKSEYGDTEEIQAVMKKIEEFEEREGRRPRILASYHLINRLTKSLYLFYAGSKNGTRRSRSWCKSYCKWICRFGK